MPASVRPAPPACAGYEPAQALPAGPRPQPLPAGPADVLPPRRADGDACLRSELVGAVDHDLRTALTTVLGALQTMARPELAPADPDLAALLSAGLAQAQRMRGLLDELRAAASPMDGRPLVPLELARLVREAAGEGGEIGVEVPADLPPVHVSAPGLRRALAGILQRGRLGAGARVKVEGNRGDCRITITARANRPPTVPRYTAQLLATMNCLIEEALEAGPPALRLTFPGACREGSG